MRGGPHTAGLETKPLRDGCNTTLESVYRAMFYGNCGLYQVKHHLTFFVLRQKLRGDTESRIKWGV